MRSTTSSAGRVASLGQELLDDARQAMGELVDEAQVRAVVHLLGARAVGAAGLFGQLVQKQVQQPRLVERPQLREVTRFPNCRFMATIRGVASALRREEVDGLASR